MKKSALIFLVLFIFSPLLAHAQRPGDDNADTGSCGPLDATACAAIKTLFASPPPDGPWYNQNPSQFAKKITGAPADEIFGERYTYAQINWIINSIATMLNPAAGIDSPGKLFEFIDAIKNAIPATGKIPTIQDYAKLGPAGLFAGGMAALYTNPPASGVQEIKYMATRLLDIGTGVQPALAQGYGFTGLGGTSGSAVRALWTASRNMAYLIMIILLIASGFLIMFRVKINPQTVVSLQTMIPKLIITMLLVTFSFAIAGLVIDLIYVAIAAFAGFLSMGGILSDLPGAINNLANRSFSFYVWLQAPISLIFVAILSIGMGILGIIMGFASGGVLSLPGFFGGLIVGAIIGIILTIWIWIVLWKIFAMLIKAYVMLILQICIAPLQIMLDLIPGQQGFGPWFRNIVSNASVFATVPIMLAIQHILSGNWITNTFFLKLNTVSGLGGVSLNLPYLGSKLESTDFLITWLVGFTIFSLTPKIADMIRDALKVPAFKYGSALDESFNRLKSGLTTIPRYGIIDPTAAEFEYLAKTDPTGMSATTAGILRKTSKTLGG